LLAQLLGGHSKITSVGELHHLRAYMLNDRQYYDPPDGLVCACGSRFAECGFWQDVLRRLQSPLSGIELNPKYFGWQGQSGQEKASYERVLRRIIMNYPDLLLFRGIQKLYGGKTFVANNMRVYDSLFRAAKTNYIVDSSKGPTRFRLLYESCPQKFMVLALQRDYRAVAYSQLMRGIKVEDSVKMWARIVVSIEKALRRVPKNRIIRVRYEELCGHPKAEMTRICRNLGLDYESDLTTRPTVALHDLGGSPSKRDPEKRKITLDTRYLHAFSKRELDKMRRLAGEAAELAGYVS
jgi:hypothetical protein